MNSPLNVFNRIDGIKEFTQFLDEKNQNNINNIAVSDRLLFANLNYEYYTKQIKFFSPFKPGNKIVHHFQLKNPLPSNFSENFVMMKEQNDSVEIYS